MTKQEMILHNETLARFRIVEAYERHGIVSAMRLCQTYLDVTPDAAYREVMTLCGDRAVQDGE